MVASLFPLEMNFITRGGLMQWFWATGAMAFGLVVIIANLKILIIQTDHSIGALIINFLSILSFFITWIVVSSINSTEIYLTIGQYLPL